MAAIVPPPRANQVIYRGVLAANASWRNEVIPKPKAEAVEAACARRSKRLTRTPRVRLEGERPSWADLFFDARQNRAGSAREKWTSARLM